MRRQDLNIAKYIYIYMNFLSKSCFLYAVPKKNNAIAHKQFFLWFYTLCKNLMKIGYFMKEKKLTQDLVLENQFSTLRHLK